MKGLILALLLIATAATHASENKLGLGVMIGNPTGLSGKYWLNGERAVDAGLAYSFGKHSDVSLHSDYLLHKEGFLVFNDQHPLDLFYGIGGRMEFADDLEIGVRVPVGVAHRLEGQQAELFGEVAPIIDLISKTGLEIHIAVGGRYYF